MLSGICPNRSTTVLMALLVLGVTVSSAADPRLPQPMTGAGGILPVAAVTDDTAEAELNKLVKQAVSVTSNRFLTANVHTPWQILHGILALRQDFDIKVDGQKTSALKWLSEGNEWKGDSIVRKTPYGGEFHRFTKPYHFEGHPNQFLAILTMSELSTDHEFLTSRGEAVTIDEMLNNAKMTVNDREEITWTLWTLSRYLPIDSQWINKDGEAWSMERLVQIQTYADVNQAACGGTHGLFALSLARNSFIFTGKQPRGIWLEADQKIKRYIAESRSLQNADGTFSTSYFTGPGKSDEFGKRIATSGHILEFLMVAADDKELQKPWLRNAVRAVANDLVENRSSAADCGPLYHALHALVLYGNRKGFLPVKEAAPEQKVKPADELKSKDDTETKPAPKEDAPDAEKTTPATTTETATEPTAVEKTNSKSKPELVKPLFETKPVSIDSPSLRQGNTESSTSIEKSRQSAELLILEKVVRQAALNAEIPPDPSAAAKAAPIKKGDTEESGPPVVETPDKGLEQNAERSRGMSGDEAEPVGDFLPPTSD
ncbi:MAG: hypothetical protein O2820_17990 [Planctomycetota bacterium]|nr:hypothetical protein [Planctomycetota bacterium]MDA1251111.1 hypothetical protein [Planctomycetota bacterium]